LHFLFKVVLCASPNIILKLGALDFLKIVGHSWTLTQKGFLFKYLLGSFGTVLAILLIAKNFFNADVTNSALIGIGGIICILLLIYCKNFVSLMFKYWQFKLMESKYGEAIIVIKECSSIVHNLKEKSSFTDKEFLSAVIFICNELKLFFDKKTKSTCSVSIKIPAASEHPEHINSHVVTASTTVENLCRDPQAKSRDTDAYKEIEHTIIGNTPYSHILDNIKTKKNQLYYLNQNINGNPEYRNTSRSAYTDGILPYKSEIACPLIRFGGEQTNYDVLGFICLDSNREKVFNEKYDPKIIENISDELYDLIVSRTNLLKHKSTKDGTS